MARHLPRVRPCAPGRGAHGRPGFRACSTCERLPHLHHAHERLGDPGPIADVLLRGGRPRIQFRFESLLDSVQGMQCPLHSRTVFFFQAGCFIAPARSSRTNTRARANAARYPSRYASVPDSRSDSPLTLSYRASSAAISTSMGCKGVQLRFRLRMNSSASVAFCRFSCRRSFRDFAGFFGFLPLSAIVTPSSMNNHSTGPHHTSFHRKSQSREFFCAPPEHICRNGARVELGSGGVPAEPESPRCCPGCHRRRCATSARRRPPPSPRRLDMLRVIPQLREFRGWRGNFRTVPYGSGTNPFEPGSWMGERPAPSRSCRPDVSARGRGPHRAPGEGRKRVHARSIHTRGWRIECPGSSGRPSPAGGGCGGAATGSGSSRQSTSATEVTRCSTKLRTEPVAGSKACTCPPPTDTGSTIRRVATPWAST